MTLILAVAAAWLTLGAISAGILTALCWTAPVHGPDGAPDPLCGRSLAVRDHVDLTPDDVDRAFYDLQRRFDDDAGWLLDLDGEAS